MTKNKLFFQKDSIVLFLLFSLLYFILTFIIIPDASPFLKYPLLAKQYLGGVLDQNRIPDLSPVYFYFNVLIMFLFKSIMVSVKVIHVIHVFIVSFSALFLFHTFKLFFSKVLSFVGVFLFAFSYSLIVYTKIIEPESFVMFFLSGFIYFINKKNFKGKDIVFAGIFFSLGVLTRSNFLPLVLIIPLFLWINKVDKRNWIKNTFLFIIPVILSVLFLIIRNYNIRGEFSPYASAPGYILFEGNNPNSSGQSAIYPPLVNDIAFEFPKKPDFHHEVYRMFARKIKGEDLSILEVNNFWGDKAKNYIFDQPLIFFNLISKKIQYFFHNYRRHDLNNAYIYDAALKHSHFPLFPFWIISILALLGIFLSRYEWKQNFIFLILFFIQFAVLIVSYVSDRQRVAVLPVFVFFTLYSIDYFMKNKKKAVFLIPILIISFFFLFVKTDFMAEEDYIWKVTNKSYDNWIEAKAYRGLSNVNGAKAKMYDSISSSPWMVHKRRLAYIPFDTNEMVEIIEKKSLNKSGFSKIFSNAIFFVESGKLEKGEKLLLELFQKGFQFKRDFFHSSQPLYYLGVIEVKRQNYNKAIRYFKRALENNPGSPFALSQMFVLTGNQEYKNKIIRYFDKIDADFFIGKALLELGNPQLAKTYFENVLKYFPIYRKALIYYAVTLGRLKEYRKAAFVYLKALKRRLDPVYFEKDIINIYRNWSFTEKDNPVPKYYLGVILGQFGNYKQAIEVLKEALALSNINNKKMVKVELNRMKKFSSSYKIGK